MTRVLWLLSLSALTVGAMTACGPSDPKTDSAIPVGDDDDDDTAPTDTAPPGPPEAVIMTMYAEIAWDADTGLTSTYGYSGYDIPSTFIFRFGTEDWDQNPQNFDDYCSVILDVTGQPNAEWAADAGQLLGVDYAGGEVTTDCTDFIDTSAFLGGTPAEQAIPSFAWSLGIGGTLDGEIGDLIEAQLGSEYLDLFGGGHLNTTFLDPSETNYVYFTANELDENRQIVVDDSGYTVLIPLANLGDESGMISALYTINLAISIQ